MAPEAKHEELVFSMEELAKCNTVDRCCVAIRGKVYDVTKFLSCHPGGWDKLYLNGGKDATVLFEAYHPDWVAEKKLDSLLVGTLQSSEYPSFPPMSPMYKALRKRVNE